MAVTAVVSDLNRNVAGARRVHTGTLTLTGTQTVNGDVVPTAAQLGLTVIEDITFTPFFDSTTAPTVEVVAKWQKTTGKTSFWGVNAVAAAGNPLQQSTASLTGYTGRFTAVGR